MPPTSTLTWLTSDLEGCDIPLPPIVIAMCCKELNEEEGEEVEKLKYLRFDFEM